ncbi:MAG: FAD-dependent oxidoreductase [Pirellulales bacterium]
MTVHDTTPVWEEVQLPRYEPLSRPDHFDVVIIGGGVTGLSAAYFLKQAGKRVCLLERGRLTKGDSGHTTAHLTCVTDMRLRGLVRAFGPEQAALTWYAGIAALDLIEQAVVDNEISCNFRRVPGFMHASLEGHRDETDELRAEAGLARALGFDADFVQRVALVDKPGFRIADQGKFHPTAYLAGLVRFVAGDGSVIHEQSDVTAIEDDPLVVVANDVRVSCEYVVIGTHVPLMGKAPLVRASLLQSKLAPYSSYVVSGEAPLASVPDLCLWDTSDPYYYLRVDHRNSHARVIFGGKDHKTGQVTDTEACFEKLEQMLRELLPSVEIDSHWSGQVIATNDGLPLIGETAPRQFVATGFNGNGYTFATIAGLMARDALLGHANPWQELFSVDRRKVRGGAWNYIKENLDFPYYLLADRLHRPERKQPADLERGEGAILKIEGQRVACSRTDDGQLHEVSPVCTHLGCLVRWNSAEQTWDCPCHGSRFQPTGEVIAGPAESPLEPATTPTEAHAK